MSTPQRTLTPKNHVSTGINKKLLTPCRRVGLSRSKNTPKTKCTNELVQSKKIFALGNDACDQTSKNKHTSTSHESAVTCKFPLKHGSRRNIDFNAENTPEDVSSSEHDLEENLLANQSKCKKLKMDSNNLTNQELTALESQIEEDPNLTQQHLPVDVRNLLQSKTDVLETSMFEEKEPVCIKTSMENLTVSPYSLSPMSKSVLLENESDDEFFTSSPETDKKQRENLCKLISKMERELLVKQDTLESLKRAQKYRKLHNLEELHNATEQWLRGCRLGLQDLLRKRQEHEQIRMESLMEKLRIPHEITAKLNLS